MTGRTYFWIYGKSEGRPFRSGAYGSREQAASEGIRLCGADFEVFELPTRDKGMAGNMIKGALAKRVGSASMGFIKHRLGSGNIGKDARPEIMNDEGW